MPVANLVGEANRGWTYAKYLLGHERTGIARVGQSKRELLFLKRLALARNKGASRFCTISSSPRKSPRSRSS